MVKEPQAGRVKTRLACEIGVVGATFFYRHAARAVVRRLMASTCWRCVLAVAPDGATASRYWPGAIERRGQGRGDLGQRMQRIMDWTGRGPVLIIGTDIPAISTTHIRDAFRRLVQGDALLGPTPDGGYWAVGLKRVPRVLRPFDNVRWSSRYAFADTAANLPDCAINTGAKLSDVDDKDSWLVSRDWAGRIVLPHMARH